jgi:hypothetical protein
LGTDELLDAEAEDPSRPLSRIGNEDDLVPALDNLEGGAGIDTFEGGIIEAVGSKEREGDIRWAEACDAE